MERLSTPQFHCACGRDVAISPAEIAAWRANDALEHMQVVDAMRALLPRVDHAPCASSSGWAITIVARILDRDESFVRAKYEDYVEWRDGR